MSVKRRFKKKCAMCGTTFKAKLDAQVGHLLHVICQKCRRTKCSGCGRFVSAYRCEICHSCNECGCNCCRDRVTGKRISQATWNRIYCSICSRIKSTSPIESILTLSKVKSDGQALARAAMDKIGKCKCRKRSHWREVTPHQKSFIVNTSHRPLGFEIELGEWGNIPITKLLARGYEKKFDRSVWPSEHELVSPVLSGDTVLTELGLISDVAKRGNANVNDSCGYHVHVGCDDFSGTFLRSILLLWMSMEQEILGKLCDVTRRRENPYCLSVASYPNASSIMPMLLDTKSHKISPRDLAQRLLYTNTSEGAHQNVKGDHYFRGRYYTLNLHSLFYRGTVEFRCKEAMLDPTDMCMWTMFCLNFVEASMSIKDADLKRFVSEPNILRFCSMYMPHYLSNWAIDQATKFRNLGNESCVPHVDIPSGRRRGGESTTLAGLSNAWITQTHQNIYWQQTSPGEPLEVLHPTRGGEEDSMTEGDEEFEYRTEDLRIIEEEEED